MEGLFDIHTHILPDVDDGAQTVEDALTLLEKEYADGVRGIVCTPHFRLGLFEAPQETIRERFQMLQDVAAGRWPDLRLFLGSEVHVHEEMLSTIASGRVFLLGNTRAVLTEFSSFHDGATIRRTIQKLRMSGLIPVLAHCERYPALVQDLDLLEEICEGGCRLQVNADSVLGKLGFRSKRFCRTLMERDLLDFIATDAHDAEHRPPRLGACAAYLTKKRGEAYARRILVENPRSLLQEST